MTKNEPGDKSESTNRYDLLQGGVVRRKEKRVLGLFIDGTGLDRATRRLDKKIDLTRLVRGVSSGQKPVVARYYTLIPYEDDSRQRAFLDAVQRAGLTVIVKRLPPKGINRQVSVDIEMAGDIVAFALGHSKFSTLSEYRSEQNRIESEDNLYGTNHEGQFNERTSNKFGFATSFENKRVGNMPGIPVTNSGSTKLEASLDGADSSHKSESLSLEDPISPQNRIITVVCPSRELAYPITLAKELGVQTVTADFGQFNSGDILKSASKWIDLSDSETIWRE